MAVNEVANPRQTILGTNFNLKKPLNGVAYPVVSLAVAGTLVLFAVGLAFRVGLPLMGSVTQRIPVVGEQLSQGSGGPQFEVAGN